MPSDMETTEHSLHDQRQVPLIMDHVILAVNSNNFTGEIPPILGNMSKLYWRDLADNQLTGSIPISTSSIFGLDLLKKVEHLPNGGVNKKELARATTIRRAVRQGQPSVEALHDQSTTTDPGAFSRGVAGGFDTSSWHTDAGPIRDVEHIDAREKINMFEKTPLTGPSHPYTGLSHPSSTSSSCCKCKEYKDSQDKLFEKVEAIAKAVEKLRSKRGVIPSKKVREPYTPTTAIRRKKKTISQVLTNRKSKKITAPPFPKVVKIKGPFKKVNICTELGATEKRDL
ncbi:hypothetical protein FXO38_07888 [Capsicum annuum]|nr:hypothetical protein FXO38_07888 [Capsicum annuum]